MEKENKGEINCNRCTRYIPQMSGRETGGLGNKRTIADQLNGSIIMISQNTEKNLEDGRRLAATQTPVENNQLMLLWKTLKRVK